MPRRKPQPPPPFVSDLRESLGRQPDAGLHRSQLNEARTRLLKAAMIWQSALIEYLALTQDYDHARAQHVQIGSVLIPPKRS